jgi:hypothetical protein
VRVLTELTDELDARGFAAVADAVGYAHLPAEQRGARRVDRGAA